MLDLEEVEVVLVDDVGDDEDEVDFVFAEELDLELELICVDESLLVREGHGEVERGV